MAVTFTGLHLSDNEMIDIISLAYLEMSEELYLAEDDIYAIDRLAFLTRLSSPRAVIPPQFGLLHRR